MREKFSQKIVSESVTMWYNITFTKISEYDASEMLGNVTDYVVLLSEWDEGFNEKKRQ